MDTWCNHQNIVPPLLEWMLSRAEYTRTDRLLITNCITGQMWPAGRTFDTPGLDRPPYSPQLQLRGLNLVAVRLQCVTTLHLDLNTALGPKTSQTHFLFSDYWGTIKLADHTLEV